jgi:two-component system nitrate/nitrite response regulator NarL
MLQKAQTGSEKVRVLIVHESRIVRDGIASLLGQAPNIIVVEPTLQETEPQEGQVGGTVDIVLLVSEICPNVSENRIQKIKQTYFNAKVVVLGALGTENETLECIENGASGYILPNSSLEHIIETIYSVHKGEASCPPHILAVLFERISSLRFQLQIIQDNELESLTTREFEILQYISDGMSNKEIATNLKVELQTIKNHVHAILEKLQVRNRREAAAFTHKFDLAVSHKTF